MLTMSVHSYTTDTSDEAAEIQLECLRKMTPSDQGSVSLPPGDGPRHFARFRIKLPDEAPSETDEATIESAAPAQA